jgi:hypothetical protein
MEAGKKKSETLVISVSISYAEYHPGTARTDPFRHPQHVHFYRTYVRPTTPLSVAYLRSLTNLNKLTQALGSYLVPLPSSALSRLAMGKRMGEHGS